MEVRMFASGNLASSSLEETHKGIKDVPDVCTTNGSINCHELQIYDDVAEEGKVMRKCIHEIGNFQ